MQDREATTALDPEVGGVPSGWGDMAPPQGGGTEGTGAGAATGTGARGNEAGRRAQGQVCGKRGRQACGKPGPGKREQATEVVRPGCEWFCRPSPGTGPEAEGPGQPVKAWPDGSAVEKEEWDSGDRWSTRGWQWRWAREGVFRGQLCGWGQQAAESLNLGLRPGALTVQPWGLWAWR